MKASVVFILLVLAAVVTLATEKKVVPVNVYVFTSQNQSGFTDEDQIGRDQTVKDLQKQLAKDSEIEIVSSEQSADVSLQVALITVRDTGAVIRYGQNDHPQTVHEIVVGLTAGAYSSTFVGASSPTRTDLGRWYAIDGTWADAANDAAKQIEKWIKLNHDKLILDRAN